MDRSTFEVPEESGESEAGHAPAGDESATRSTRCSLTQFRAGGCAYARNEHSGKAAAPALHDDFAGLGSACPALNPTSRSSHAETVRFAAFIGIDWADRKHDVCLPAAGSEKPRALRPRASPGRHRRGPKSSGSVSGAAHRCLPGAQPGPIVSALLEHDFFVLFPVNPSTLAKYREPSRPAAPRMTPPTPQIALDLLLRHPDKLKPLRRESAHMRALQRAGRGSADLVDDRVRITNRITLRAEGLLPPGSAVVSRQGHRRFRRLLGQVAKPAGGQARPSRDPVEAWPMLLENGLDVRKRLSIRETDLRPPAFIRVATQGGTRSRRSPQVRRRLSEATTSWSVQRPGRSAAGRSPVRCNGGLDGATISNRTGAVPAVDGGIVDDQARTRHVWPA